DERFRQLGKEILAYGARTLFRPSGFLRESSSHYHLLLCRSYLEAFWMAGGKADQKFWEGLKDRLVDMTRASAFFLRSGYFPRIGDVSPDFPTAFHRGIPAVGAAVLAEDSVSLPPPEEIGWHSFFLPSGASEEKERPPLPEIEGWEDAGYYRLVKGKWELFVYLNPDGHVPAWSHGHSDLLGFLLMYGGHPVLVDSGRATYADNPLGHYGRGASSHNTFRVDGLAPCLVHAHNGYVPLMMKEYFAYPAEVRIERREDGLKARLMCSGYQRIALGIRVERVFLLGEGGLRIIDEVLGSGRHLLESFFHFHPDVGVRRKGQDALGLSLPGGEELEFLGKVDPDESVVLEKGKESGDVMGWYSPEYGEAIPCWSFLLRGRRSLPLHRSWTIRPAHR
ncbi:MAG: heparinase II/III-family protein, partial [bacterium]|nr:heparinase II/III-family protein [bacterium]